MTRSAVRSRARPVRSERGSVSVQMVVIMPLLFLIAFTGLQAGLYFYGRSGALSAATTGARAAAAEHGTAEDCQRAAAAFIASLGDVLTQPRIQCARTAGEVGRLCAELVYGYSPTPEAGDFPALRAALDASLAGARLARDRAGEALAGVMIPEALDYPL